MLRGPFGTARRPRCLTQRDVPLTTRLRHLLICLPALCVLAIPAIAQASPQAVIRDCAQDGDLDHQYSNGDLQNAKKQLPSDLNEYSDCSDVIAGAMGGPPKQHRGGGGAGAVAGVSAHRTAHRQRAHAARTRHERTPRHVSRRGEKPRVSVGGRTVEPGSGGTFHVSGAANGVPLPLLLALIAVGLLMAGGGLYALRRRIPALSSIPRPRLSLPRVRFPRIRR
jgi:hypothetical protein